MAKSIDPSIVIPVQCDVTKPESNKAAAEQVEKDAGYIDVLINNAGIIGPDHKAAHNAQTIEELQQIFLKDWDKWDTTWQTNTAAVLGVSAAFLKLLDEGNRRRGWVVGKNILLRQCLRETDVCVGRSPVLRRSTVTSLRDMPILRAKPVQIT